MNACLRLKHLLGIGVIAVLALGPRLSPAAILKSKTIDGGGSGPYKAIAVSEESLPDFVVYRPDDMGRAASKEGQLPVLVWANGGCMDSSIHHERLLSEVASHGYVVVAIGKLQMTIDERVHRATADDKLLEAIEWITKQAGDTKSDYYKRVDLSKLAAGGQSCGGAQALRVADDRRIKTYLIFNAGMGPMTMAGASRESLKALHGPIVYIVGGPSDVAYRNALLDYERMDKVAVAFASVEVGHGGTFAEEFGGSYARMGLSWLDWQLKDKGDRASVFLSSDLKAFPGWTMKAKNFEGASSDKAAEPPASQESSVKVLRDIAYREGDSKAWRLDLAMPAAKAKAARPALVIVHGGGWRGGSRTVDVFQNMMMEYAAKGYVTVNIDYRLLGEAPFPACIEDVKCAVRWLRAHAKEYDIDPDRIGAYGHSAGGHLALMLAVAPKEAGLEGDGGWNEFSSVVNVAAGGSPATELGQDVPMAKREWWPIGYIGPKHPPLFLIQGLQDRVVLPERTKDFVEKMKAAGGNVECLEVEGGHGVAYAEQLEVTKPALEKFFGRHLKPETSAAARPGVVTVENGGSGPFPAIATEEASLPGMTIFRPRDLVKIGADTKLPILLWGNGACANTTFEHKNFLSEIASHGYLILAIGRLDQIERRGEGSKQPTKPDQLIGALNWMEKQSQSPESVYAGRVAIDRVAAMGMSCGALQAISVAADPRLRTVVICNSGVLPEPSPRAGMPPLSKDALKAFHTPVLYIMGGPSDIAYNNAMDDFKRVNHVPIVMANLDVGHGGTFAQPHGGKFTRVALGWLNWQLKGQTNQSRMFLGEDSVLMKDPDWRIETKNFDVRQN